jgi:hypothetical protein
MCVDGLWFCHTLMLGANVTHEGDDDIAARKSSQCAADFFHVRYSSDGLDKSS